LKGSFVAGRLQLVGRHLFFPSTIQSAWGLTLSRALLEWFHEVQWPIEASEPDTVGITLLELVASF